MSNLILNFYQSNKNLIFVEQIKKLISIFVFNKLILVQILMLKQSERYYSSRLIRLVHQASDHTKKRKKKINA